MSVLGFFLLLSHLHSSTQILNYLQRVKYHVQLNHTELSMKKLKYIKHGTCTNTTTVTFRGRWFSQAYFFCTVFLATRPNSGTSTSETEWYCLCIEAQLLQEHHQILTLLETSQGQLQLHFQTCLWRVIIFNRAPREEKTTFCPWIAYASLQDNSLVSEKEKGKPKQQTNWGMVTSPQLCSRFACQHLVCSSSLHSTVKRCYPQKPRQKVWVSFCGHWVPPESLLFENYFLEKDLDIYFLMTATCKWFSSSFSLLQILSTALLGP